jgi:hypothetical protein
LLPPFKSNEKDLIIGNAVPNIVRIYYILEGNTPVTRDIFIFRNDYI